MKGFEELTDSEPNGTGGVGPWIPEDVYANFILDGVVCYGQLSGVVTAGGDTIQVQYISARTTSCASQGKDDERECACLSAVSSNFGTYPVPVQAWGDYDKICGFSIWEAKGNIVEAILKEMSKRLAWCRDAEIYSNLITDVGSPNIDVETVCVCEASKIEGGCCTFTFDLYNSIISVQKHMQGDAYEPDYVIMHPSVAQYIYFKDGAGYHHGAMPQVKFDGKGQLTTISGMKVIECCNATDCAGGSGVVQAVVIDSSRAVGEVWGKKPTFEVQRIPECDQWKHVLWQYWGSSILDPLATGWVSNP